MRPMTFSNPGGYHPPEPEPFVTPNTTPLIDVMLVLLIMMILAIPAALHTLPVDLPTAGPAGASPPVHELAIGADGAPTLDGTAVASAGLATAVGALARDPAKPVLRIRADEALPYGLFHARMGTVRQAGMTRVGFVGLGAMRGAIAG